MSNTAESTTGRVGVRYLAKDLEFLPMAVCPICGDDLEIHDWLDMAGVVATSPTGRETGRVVACDRVMCGWFARCQNYATHAEAHPVLGPVPACDRCTDIGKTAER